MAEEEKRTLEKLAEAVKELPEEKMRYLEGFADGMMAAVRQEKKDA